MSLVESKTDTYTMQGYKRSVAVAAGIAVLCIGIGIGVLVGYFSAPVHTYANPETRQADESISDRLQKEMSADRLRENLRHYARKPHVAGTPEDLEGADDIRRTWLDQGLDSAKLVPYEVYLQHPPSADDEARANKIQIINPANGSAVFTSALREDPFGEEELLQDGIPPPFNAYAAPGDVMGDLVYVNYGRIEDFEYLQEVLLPTINFTGKILIARYGMTRRITKVENAQDFGAVGLILFSDPLDYSVEPEIGLPYPNGMFLPSTAAQSGSIAKEVGDPLTPGYPAKDFAYRTLLNETEMPRIPVHPIGFGDAEKLLRAMTGPQPGPDWLGSMDTLYQVGPGFKSPYEGMKARLVVNSVSARMWTYNTVGFIRGEVEPDRYVIIGNHRDAWALGSIDPTSGTATLMEISRAFGKLKKEGWRPRRTLVFCTFAAEEYGLIGSIEWTEEFNRILADRAVAYLNLDIAVAGRYMLWTSASPHLRPVVYAATRKVPDPDPSNNRKTVYDTMKERRPDTTNPTVPLVTNMKYAAISDHRGFISRLGVPCIMIYYDTYEVSFYSLYHTSYETVRLMESYIDPEYKYHLATAQTFGEMARILAESLVLPFDVQNYATDLFIMWHYLNTSSLATDIKNHGITLDNLQRAVSDFVSITREFQKRVQTVDTTSAIAVRQINDQMMQLERAFIGTLPNNRLDKHLLFSPRLTESRSGDDVPEDTFPGITDALHNIHADPNQSERWKVVAQQVAILTHSIESACAVLKNVTSW